MEAKSKSAILLLMSVLKGLCWLQQSVAHLAYMPAGSAEALLRDKHPSIHSTATMVVGRLALLEAMGATLKSAGQIGIAPLSCESFPVAHYTLTGMSVQRMHENTAIGEEHAQHGGRNVRSTA